MYVSLFFFKQKGPSYSWPLFLLSFRPCLNMKALVFARQGHSYHALLNGDALGSLLFLSPVPLSSARLISDVCHGEGLLLRLSSKSRHKPKAASASLCGTTRMDHSRALKRHSEKPDRSRWALNFKYGVRVPVASRKG